MSSPHLVHPISISKPKVLGYMSVDVNREYHGNLSQLKFLNPVPKASVCLDLNDGIDRAVKRTSAENNEKIDLLLKFLVDRAQYLNLQDSVISYRRSFISLMRSCYHNEHVCIVGSLFNDSIYLCSMETSLEKQRRLVQTKQDKKFCAWGYKFEQYLLSDLPNLQPDIEKPVLENEEFSIYYQCSLGDHNLVYGAQIDGLLVTNKMAQKPPNSNNFDENVNYLSNNSFIELKTNRELQSFKQEQNFKRQKMLSCWCQCYLADLKGLLVGFRDDRGIVNRLQCFDTNDILDYCQNEWQPEPAIRFLNYFLSYVKSCLKNHPNAHKSKKEPVNLMFDVRGSHSVEVSECPVSQNNIDFYKILPDWYVKTKNN